MKAKKQAESKAAVKVRRRLIVRQLVLSLLAKVLKHKQLVNKQLVNNKLPLIVLVNKLLQNLLLVQVKVKAEASSSSSSSETAGGTYTLKQGEGLYRAAANNGMSLSELLALNPGLTANSSVAPGTALKVK